MKARSHPHFYPHPHSHPRPFPLWLVAMVVAVAVHVGLAYCVLRDGQFEPAGNGAEGMGIELTLATAGGAVPAAEKPAQPSKVSNTETTSSVPDTPPPTQADTSPTQVDTPTSVAARPAVVKPAPNPARVIPKADIKPNVQADDPEPTPAPIVADAPIIEAPEPDREQPDHQTSALTQTDNPTQPSDTESSSHTAPAVSSAQASSEQAGTAQHSASGGSAGAYQEDVYLSQIKAWLAQHKTYPRVAAMRRQEGIVLMQIIIDREGNIIDYQVKKKSGHRLLDKEARKMMERASPVPPIPESIHQDALELVIPIEFFLV